MKVWQEPDGWWFAEAFSPRLRTMLQAAGTTYDTALANLATRLIDWERA